MADQQNGNGVVKAILGSLLTAAIIGLVATSVSHESRLSVEEEVSSTLKDDLKEIKGDLKRLLNARHR